MSKYYVTCSWSDVPHLSKEDCASMLASLPPHQRDARARGIPQLGAGAVYPISEEDFVCEPFDIPKQYSRAYGLDVGWNNTAAVWLAYDTDADIMYITSEYKRGQAEPAVHASAIKARGEWIPGVIDPASRGRAQKDGEQLMGLYQTEGLQITPAKNAVEAGLFFVYERLSTGRLKVFKTCTQLLYEYRIYRRDDKGKVVKENDHLMDAMRYVCYTGIWTPGYYEDKIISGMTGGGKHESHYNPLSSAHIAQDRQQAYDPFGRNRR